MAPRPAYDRKRHKTNPDKVRPGDLLALTYYVKVRDGDWSHTQWRTLPLDPGIGELNVHGRALMENASSADYFAETEAVTPTRLAELLVTSYHRPLTVCFTKVNGEERTLRGRLVAPEPLLGRSHVEDLDVDPADKGGRLRLVDHRSLKWLVVDGMKYTVKP